MQNSINNCQYRETSTDPNDLAPRTSLKTIECQGSRGKEEDKDANGTKDQQCWLFHRRSFVSCVAYVETTCSPCSTRPFFSVRQIEANCF